MYPRESPYESVSKGEPREELTMHPIACLLELENSSYLLANTYVGRINFQGPGFLHVQEFGVN